MVGEQPSSPNRRLTDDNLIDRELDISEEMGAGIDHATARMIASQIHGGQASDLYSFTSTGFIANGLLAEINRNWDEFKEDEPVRRRIAHLAAYVAQRQTTEEGRQAIEGFSTLWLEQPDEATDLCPCCSEHISHPHRVGCPLGVDDDQQLSRVQVLHAEHGKAVLFWLEYLGFRNGTELEEAAATFRDHYYGFYPDLDAFRQSYDIGPEEYLEQQYLIVEDDGGIYVFDR